MKNKGIWRNCHRLENNKSRVLKPIWNQIDFWDKMEKQF
jgi:hypothetical protein